jgi:hypothetical protein
MTVLSALEMTLFDLGFAFELGSGIRAAQSSFLATA